MDTIARRLLLWFAFGSCALGCRREEPAPAESAATAPPPTVTSVAAPQPEVKPAPTPELASKQAPETVADFTPPFPNRLELFLAPKRAQSMARTNDELGESVELKGFINVDEPRVVLSIDGVVSPVGEGNEKYGVRVISIQPPSVVLQRGRNRWTATLD